MGTRTRRAGMVEGDMMPKSEILRGLGAEIEPCKANSTFGVWLGDYIIGLGDTQDEAEQDALNTIEELS